MKKKYIKRSDEPSSGLLMRMQKLLVLLLFVFFGVSNVRGQVTVSGAVTGDGSYTSLGAAFAAIGPSQAGANIIVDISGNTTEGVIAVLNGGNWNSLIIRPSGGLRTISGALASELIQFNGADNVTIDGLNSGGNGLTITNTNAAATAGVATIRFLADATNNTITNCTLLGSGQAPTGTAGGVVFFDTGFATGNDGNTISNCNIGPAGAILPVKLIYSLGTNTNEGTCNSEITITGCNLYDFFIANNYSAAIYAGLGNSAWTVSNNKIYQTGLRTFTSAFTMYGIYFLSNTYGNNVRITGNTIGYASNAGTGTFAITGGSLACGFQGIYTATSSTASTACHISNNIISDISLNATGSGAIYGINNGASSSTNAINIEGNTIRNFSIAGNTGIHYGIFAGNASILNCNNNRIENWTRSGSGIFYGINYGASPNITVNGNSIVNLNSTHATTTSAFAGIYGSTSSLIETITNNTITGLTSSSTGAQTIDGIKVGTGAANKTIQNNILTNISVPPTSTGAIHGIRMTAGGAMNVISGNTVSSLTGPNSSGGTNGVFINAGTVNNIYNNKVYGLTASGTASCVFGVMIQGGTSYNIYNNIIGDLTAPNATSAAIQPHQIIGINTWGQAANIYNNTIVLNGTNNGTGFGSSVLSTSGPLTLRNNILINNLPASGVQGVSTILRVGASGVSNYAAASNNNLFKGSVIYTTDGTVVDNTLAAFKTRAVGRDVSSVTETPTFVSTVGSDATYLHINTTTPTQIESGGAPIATVTNDFDGDVRNLSTPDIGADEFTGIANDLFGPVVTHTPDPACTPGARTISATFADASGIPTTGVGLPVAYWRINSGAYNAAVGTYNAGTGAYDFTIGTGSVLGDSVYYYFVVQDNAATPNVSVYPSLGAAGITANPPMAGTHPTAPIALATPMSGVYTVGVGGNYTTLTAAVSDYNARCLNGPITFSLTDATYVSETYPIIIQQNADASATKTLTIKPAAGVAATISGNVAEMIVLNGADYVIVDGLNAGGSSLTISNASTASTANASTIRFAADATNNTLTNCTILGSNTTNVSTAGGVVFFGTGTTTGNDSNTISNCNIGPVGAALPVKLIFSLGTNTNEGTCNSEITITGCNLYDFFMANGNSAAVFAATGSSAWTITNNKVYQTGLRTFTGANIMHGIVFQNSLYGNNVRITGNTIGYANSVGTGTLDITSGSVGAGFTGIYNLTASGASSPCNISDNLIANITLTSTGAGTIYGINQAGTAGTGNTINIERNIIKNISNTGNTGALAGIFAGSATTLNCNSNRIDNISRTAAGAFYGINYGQCTNVTFDLNVITGLSSTATTGTATFAGFYANSASATETFTNNTISNLSSLSTALIPINGIWNNITVSTGDRTFRNNTISNFSLPATGTGIMYGIRMPYSGALNEISGNTIHTFTGGGTINGIAIGGGATNNVFKNKIYGLSTASTASVALHGMYFSGGTTNNVYNNIIGNITAPATNLAGTPTQVNGITVASPTPAINLYHNTIVLSGTSSGATFGSSVINSGTTPVLLMRNNVFVNNCVATGTGEAAVIRRGGVAGYDATSNNNLFYAAVYYTEANGTKDLLLDTFKNRLAGAESLSVSENPTFLSMVGSDPTFLHINPAVPTQIEGAGANITLVTTDFDGDARNATAPDLGADEFAGTPLTVVAINTIGITPSVNQCTAVSRTVTANVTAGTNNITSVVLKYWFNGVAQTPITMTGTLTAGTTSDFTATIPMVANVNVTWEVHATDAATTKLKVGSSYKDAPLSGLVGSTSASLSSICPGGSSVLSANLTPQTTQYSNSFETGITDFVGGSVVGTPELTQVGYSSGGGANSLRFRTISNNADLSASSVTNIDLSAMPQAYLTFSHVAALEGPSTAADFGYVQYSSDGGTTWTNFPASSYVGTATLFNSAVCFSTKSYPNWITAITATGSVPNNALFQNEAIMIPATALTSQFKIRFRYTTNASNLYYGWLIDNVKIVSGLPNAITDYSWSDGTSVVGTTNNLSVSPTVTTTYTATLTSTGGCTITSAPITVTVGAPQPSASAHTFCSTATVANLNATGSGIQWYAASTGGSPMLPTDALTTGTYYVTQTISGCESPRLAVDVTVGSTAQPTASAQTFCTAATVANLAATGTGIQWYAGPTGGSALSATDAVSTNTYYVTQTISGCESPRLPVSVTVNTTAQPAASAQSFCSGGTVANLVATGTGIQWYAGPTGGSALLSTTALATGTYYVTQTISGCESPRLAVDVTVGSTAQPTASAQTFCTAATVADLVATGTGVQWYAGPTGGSALLSTTALSTTTYYVTQTISGCESPRLAVAVTVNVVGAPTGSSTQPISVPVLSDATIEDLVATGSNIVWYPTAADALAGTNAIPAGTQLVNGNVYYAMQTVGGCRSTAYLAVTVTVTLGVKDFALSNLKLYPNPVINILNIENGQNISTIEVYNIAGQRVMAKAVNEMSASIDMSVLAGGTYLVKVVADDAVKAIKVIKK